MALTQSAWTSKTANGFIVHTCTVLPENTDTDAYTLKTPAKFNPEKQWELYLTFSGSPDGQALPVDLWMGFSDSFALSGQDASVVATDGAKVKQILDDSVSADDDGTTYLVWTMDPYSTVADDVAYNAGAIANIKVPIAPYYAFAVNGETALTAVTATWKIVQKP